MDRKKEREREKKKGKNQKQVKKKKKNATCVRLYVLYNINAHHSRLCTWSPWEILLNDVHTTHTVLFYYSFGPTYKIQKQIQC